MKHDDELKPFLDDQGRLTEWPSKNKREAQRQVRDYLASKIETGKNYTEAEINEILNQWATTGDPALLRRELSEAGWLKHTPDGSKYWRIAYNRM